MSKNGRGRPQLPDFWRHRPRWRVPGGSYDPVTAAVHQLAAQAAFSPEERERLIVSHLPQVRWIASRIHDSLGHRVPLEDLISAGVLGLIAAVDNFEPGRNLKLSTYAEHKVRGAILDSIRGLDGIPVRKRKLAGEIERAICRVETALGRAASEEEIARELNVDLAEYQRWLVETAGVTLTSLETPLEDSGPTLLNAIADRADGPDAVLENAEKRALLAKAIERMPAIEREILSLYYHQELTLQEIGEVLKMQTQRVWQLRAQAILRLRALFAKKWPAGKRGY